MVGAESVPNGTTLLNRCEGGSEKRPKQRHPAKPLRGWVRKTPPTAPPCRTGARVGPMGMLWWSNGGTTGQRIRHQGDNLCFCIVLRLIEEVLASLFPLPAVTECARWKENTSIRRKKRPKRSRWNKYSSIRSTLKDSSFTTGRRIPPQSRRQASQAAG